jgi:GntR family transcriptional repressor for pyruvate dehydrogenase complex
VERRGKSIYVVEVQEDANPTLGIPKSILQYRNAAEMMEIRKIIEPEVAALVVKKADKASIKIIEDEFMSMEANKDLSSFIEHDSRFHAGMFRAIKNRALEAMMKNVYDLMFDTISLMLREGKLMPRSMEYHRKILSAIKEGDVDLARTYMLHHILDIEQEMYKIILSRKPRKRI